jgi:hypothetical protein
MNGIRFLFGLVVAAAGAAAMAQQPALRYTFDEASGNALDSGAAPLTDATFEGGATRSTDTPSGSGMSLDLSTDAPYAHLLGLDAADLDGLAAFTLTTWLKVETYPDAGSGNKRLLAKQGGGTFPGFSWNMNSTTNSGNPASPSEFRLGLFVGDLSAGFGSAFSDGDVGAADWTFLAATYDSTLGEMAFFSGDLDSPVTQVGTTQLPAALPTPVDGDTARFAVGLTDAAPTADTSVTGLQDDVRVYNSVLDLTALEAVRMENLQGGGGFADGDFNESGVVDGADLGVWKTNFPKDAAATHMQGDANADMDVDGSDFLVWQQELGLSGSGVAAVPEPAAGVLLACGAGLAFALNRRKVG